MNHQQACAAMTGRILIVDDLATNRIVLKVRLVEAGYVPLLAGDGATCLALARRDRPDLILLDYSLPDMAAAAVLAALRADAVTAAVPVIVVTPHADPDERLGAFLAGADEVVTRPFDDQTLLARIRGFLRARDTLEGLAPAGDGRALFGLAEMAPAFRPPGQIALVMNRPETALQIRRDLAAHLNDRILVLPAEEALSAGLSPTLAPDIFLIDTDFRGPAGGLRLMSELRSRSHSRAAGICLYAAASGLAAPAVAYDLGANDLVCEGIAGEELAARLKRLLERKRDADAFRARLQDELRLAMVDPLTGLYNRRYALAQLATIGEAAHIGGKPYAVMAVDLDRFKSVNDTWGHAAGDAVLVEVAARLAQNLRAGDLVARIGGEEFLIALPETGLADARLIAERLCQAVQERPVLLGDRGALGVTVSIGLALSGEWPCQSRKSPVTDLVDRADQALLRSKAAGRNQVTISRPAA